MTDYRDNIIFYLNYCIILHCVVLNVEYDVVVCCSEVVVILVVDNVVVVVVVTNVASIRLVAVLDVTMDGLDVLIDALDASIDGLDVSMDGLDVTDVLVGE